MKQLWKPCLGIFIIATMSTNVWGQPYDGGAQRGSAESFTEWAGEQIRQIQDAVSSLQVQLESMWSGSRSAGGIQDPATKSGYQPSMGSGRRQVLDGQQGRMPGRGQNAVADPLIQSSRPAMGRGVGGRGLCPLGTGRGGGGSARGVGAARGRVAVGAFPGQVQNVPSGLGRGQGATGVTSMGSGRGRGSGGKSAGMSSTGKGRGRRRK